MRNSVLTVVLLLPCVLTVAQAKDWSSYDLAGDPDVFSSEDSGGGSSYLGVDTRDVTSDRVGPLQLKEESGVEVTMVDQDAPAGKAGIKEQDVILSVNGEKVESVEQLRRMIHEIPSGRTITIGLSRNGQPMTIKAQLAERKKWPSVSPGVNTFKFTMPALPEVHVNPLVPEMDVPISVVVVHSSARSGLMVENLTPQLGNYFGAKDGQGVLVRSVEKGSRAEKAGFRAGDVIVKVNGESIHDSGDFTHALRSQGQKDVSVGVIRDRKEQTITLSMPEHKSQYLEEGFDEPEVDADTTIDLTDLESEIAQVKPQMELVTREVQRIKPELAKVKRDVLCQTEELKKQSKEIRRQILDQQQHIKHDVRILLGGQADI